MLCINCIHWSTMGALLYIVYLYFLRQMLHDAGELQDVLQLHDALARVSLARLCRTLSKARSLDGKCNSYHIQIINFLRNIFPLVFLLCAVSENYMHSEVPELKSQFTSILYQLILDPCDRVCFEAIMCVLGKSDGTERYFLSSLE